MSDRNQDPTQLLSGFQAMRGQERKQKKEQTASSQIEDSIQAGGQLFQTLIRAVPVVFFSLDARGRVTLLNEQGLEPLGIEPGTWAGRSIFDLAEAEPAIGDDVRRTLDGELVTALRTCFGQTCRTIYTPLRASDGQVTGALGVFVNITEQLQALLRLEQSEADLKKAQRLAKIGSWRWNLANNEVQWSEEMFRQYGYDPMADITPTFDLAVSAVHPDDRSRIAANTEDGLRTGLLKPITYRIVSKDDQVKHVWAEGELEHDAAGHPTHMIGTVQDITERTLLEEQLRHAQRLEAIGQLAAGVAHEFNNLLQIVMGFNTLTLETTAPADTRHKYLIEVQEASERGATLVSQLLGFSRQQFLQPVRLDANDLIASLSQVLRATLGEPIRVDLDLAPGLAPIRADKGGVEQVLMNLCINARDAMPQGGFLRIGTAPVRLDADYCNKHLWARPGDYVRIAVSDTGVGIPEDVMGRIFEPFFTTKGPREGSGLGLSMVYGLIEQHHGLIHVSSTPGEGSSFEVYLPVGEEVETAPKVSHEPEVPRPAGKGTVLVAEDERGIQHLTSRILEAEGYTVLAALDGEEAVRWVETNGERIDLILMDVVMPKLGGLEAYERIQALKPGISVLFQTGYELKQADAVYLADRGLRFLHKPFTPDVIRRAVRELLGSEAQVHTPGEALRPSFMVEP